MRNARMNRAPAAFVCGLLATALTAFAGGAAAQDAAAVVDRMVAAHGGMENWNRAPSVYFTDEWSLGGMTMKSNAHVEQGRRRSTLEYPDFNATIGWDGEKAWSMNWPMPSPPRFHAQLNYYFLCLPWLVKDPGVVLGVPSTATLSDDPTEYITVRVTYEPGVGDTPDDYYLLFIHPETYRLHACEYVVTYPGVVPAGRKSTPPHILVYDSHETVDGLVVPTSFTVYDPADQSVYASCKITNWSFTKPFDPAAVEMPEGAVVDNSLSEARQEEK